MGSWYGTLSPLLAAFVGGLVPSLAAFVGGLVPSLAWLWFWLREDRAHPEPRRLIALAFLSGMAAVAFAIPLEKHVAEQWSDQTAIFTAWAYIEEALKCLAALAVVLWRRDDDEPVDAVIYMICIALGFAAAENALFLLSPLSGATLFQTVITGNLRFIGATLLHTLSSSIIGLSLALSFYRSRWIKALAAIGGLLLAGLLHAAFNFLILNTPQPYLLRTFALVWAGVIALLASLEFVKRIRPRLSRM